MSKRTRVDWKQRYDDLLVQYRMLQRYVGYELNLIRHHFPSLDVLFAQLVDLIDAADPKQARPVAVGRGGGDPNNLEERGTDVALRGGFDVRPAHDRISTLNREIHSLALRVFDGLDVQGRRYARAVLVDTRRCRHKDCGMAGRRQYGINRDGTRVCRECGRELARGRRQIREAQRLDREHLRRLRRKGA